MTGTRAGAAGHGVHTRAALTGCEIERNAWAAMPDG
jgi:hypothetical protein